MALPAAAAQAPAAVDPISAARAQTAAIGRF